MLQLHAAVDDALLVDGDPVLREDALLDRRHRLVGAEFGDLQRLAGERAHGHVKRLVGVRAQRAQVLELGRVHQQALVARVDAQYTPPDAAWSKRRAMLSAEVAQLHGAVGHALGAGRRRGAGSFRRSAANEAGAHARAGVGGGIGRGEMNTVLLLVDPCEQQAHDDTPISSG